MLTVLEYLEDDHHGQQWAVCRVMLPTGEPCPKRWIKLIAEAFTTPERALWIARSVLGESFQRRGLHERARRQDSTEPQRGPPSPDRRMAPFLGAASEKSSDAIITPLGNIHLTSGRRIEFVHASFDGRNALRVSNTPKGTRGFSITIPGHYLAALRNALARLDDMGRLLPADEDRDDAVPAFTRGPVSGRVAP